MLTVTALTGPLAGRRFELSQAVVIGREGADLLLPDEQVSRRHAALRSVPGGVELRDLGSLNGTWVEGARIAEPVVVGDGARFSVGTTTFALSVPAAPSAGANISAGGPGQAFLPSPAPRARRPPGVATRLWLPAALSFLAILGAAVALLAYFALR